MAEDTQRESTSHNPSVNPTFALFLSVALSLVVPWCFLCAQLKWVVGRRQPAGLVQPLALRLTARRLRREWLAQEI